LEHSLTGTFRFHKCVPSRFVQGGREVIVYLPPGYNDDDQRYPVLYMQDGQNLFDAATAFFNQEWGLDELAECLISRRLIAPLIIVGLYNARERRVDEYTHARNGRGEGGRARLYARFLVETLKPFIDSEYRTLNDAANTGLGGSSLGGLITCYIGLRFPQVFGKLIIMSPSVWWANRAILKEVRKLRSKPDLKIWLDIGTSEGDNPQTTVRNVRELRDLLVGHGFEVGQDLRFLEHEGAGHNEKAWGYRMRDALMFLFPPSSGSIDLG
jgi:predicted alpha/beta superfamily hydrolase